MNFHSLPSPELHGGNGSASRNTAREKDGPELAQREAGIGLADRLARPSAPPLLRGSLGLSFQTTVVPEG